MCLYICLEAGKVHQNWYASFCCHECPHAIPHQYDEKCDIECWEENDFCVPIPGSTS